MTQFFAKLQWRAIAVLAILLTGCTPHPPEKSLGAPGDTRIAVASGIRNDSLQDRIIFPDRQTRDRFDSVFQSFLNEHHYSAARSDGSAGNAVYKVLSQNTVAGSPSKTSAAAPRKTEKNNSQEAVNRTASAPLPRERPQAGGSLRLYFPRTDIEYPFDNLFDAYPFSERVNGDSVTGYLTVQDSSSTSLTLKIAGKPVNNEGKTLNSLDLIGNWTRYIREHPAEGVALFRYCDGLKDFIGGREAIVRGLTALDNLTIRIRLITSDPAALDRLRTSRTLPGSLKLGRYWIKIGHPNDVVITANYNAIGERPFLDEALIRLESDGNPLLSFSLGRYDGVALWRAADLSYARRNLLKNGASCIPIGSDRYFLACNVEDSVARAYISSVAAQSTQLGSFVKAEGNAIQAVESDSLLPSPSDTAQPAAEQKTLRGAAIRAAGAAPRPVLSAPIKIIYRKDDTVSKQVAEKLLATCAHDNVPAMIFPLETKNYEALLAGGGGDACIVGWVDESVLHEKSARLRLASMYFNDEPDEVNRIDSNREIPLFSINWYLLAKSKVGLFEGRISGMYLKRDTTLQRH